MKYVIVASRGRNPDNPSERGRSNGRYQQRLEPNARGISNTLTGVQKNNLVMQIYEVRRETHQESQD